ncbi:Reticulocyte-binding protein PFD0110w [Frankliniella fusca]|uniref:Reticulocyte-binding protein PFD0110w n=1 Tax=Frankliniella fusca TaxID=407009 RepID=A0AAE1GTJ5_9NEOP|nr:Reticulocyte-binding protein PFD0110w [Frankliniella fusca]
MSIPSFNSAVRGQAVRQADRRKPPEPDRPAGPPAQVAPDDLPTTQEMGVLGLAPHYSEVPGSAASRRAHGGQGRTDGKVHVVQVVQVKEVEEEDEEDVEEVKEVKEVAEVEVNQVEEVKEVEEVEKRAQAPIRCPGCLACRASTSTPGGMAEEGSNGRDVPGRPPTRRRPGWVPPRGCCRPGWVAVDPACMQHDVAVHEVTEAAVHLTCLLHVAPLFTLSQSVSNRECWMTSTRTTESAGPRRQKGQVVRRRSTPGSASTATSRPCWLPAEAVQDGAAAGGDGHGGRLVKVDDDEGAPHAHHPGWTFFRFRLQTFPKFNISKLASVKMDSPLSVKLPRPAPGISAFRPAAAVNGKDYEREGEDKKNKGQIEHKMNLVIRMELVLDIIMSHRGRSAKRDMASCMNCLFPILSVLISPTAYLNYNVLLCVCSVTPRNGFCLRRRNTLKGRNVGMTYGFALQE